MFMESYRKKKQVKKWILNECFWEKKSRLKMFFFLNSLCCFLYSAVKKSIITCWSSGIPFTEVIQLNWIVNNYVLVENIFFELSHIDNKNQNKGLNEEFVSKVVQNFFYGSCKLQYPIVNLAKTVSIHMAKRVNAPYKW